MPSLASWSAGMLPSSATTSSNSSEGSRVLTGRWYDHRTKWTPLSRFDAGTEGSQPETQLSVVRAVRETPGVSLGRP